MEASLRLHHHRPGTLTGLDDYLFGRTSGMIGSRSQLIRGAAILAIQDGTSIMERWVQIGGVLHEYQHAE